MEEFPKRTWIYGKYAIIILVLLALSLIPFNALSINSLNIQNYSKDKRAYLSDDFLVLVGNKELRVFIKRNLEKKLTLESIDVSYGSYRCNISTDIIIPKSNYMLMILVNDSGVYLSTANGSLLRSIHMNTRYFTRCLNRIYYYYTRTIRLGLNDVKIYSALNEVNNSVVFRSSLKILRFLDRYPLYVFRDNVLVVWFKIDNQLGYLKGKYIVEVKLDSSLSSPITYSVELNGLTSDFPLLVSPAFAWHRNIHTIENVSISLREIKGRLNITALNVVLGSIRYQVPRVIMKLEYGRGEGVFIKPWVDLENLYETLSPYIVKLLDIYTSPLFAYFDPNRYYVSNSKLLLYSGMLIVSLYSLSFKAKVHGRIVGVKNFKHSPYYTIFGSNVIDFHGESSTILSLDHVSASRLTIVFIPTRLRLYTNPSPKVDRTLCMDFIDSVCLYLNNISRILYDMNTRVITLDLLLTSLFHSQLSTYTIITSDVVPYMAITVGYTPKNSFILYPIYPAVKVSNVSSIKVLKFKGHPIRFAINFLVEYANNMSSNVTIEPYFMLPLRLRISSPRTLISAPVSSNITYTYRIEDYEYDLRLGVANYPFVHLIPLSIKFLGVKDISSGLIAFACYGICSIKINNTAIKVFSPYKVRIVFFIKGNRDSIVKLLSRRIRVHDYYGIHKLYFPGIMSSLILPNNTSIVFGWSLLLPPSNDSISLVFKDISIIARNASIKEVFKPILLEESSSEENEFSKAWIMLLVFLVLIVLYIVLKPR